VKNFLALAEDLIVWAIDRRAAPMMMEMVAIRNRSACLLSELITGFAQPASSVAQARARMARMSAATSRRLAIALAV
jgi:hypothetical protein